MDHCSNDIVIFDSSGLLQALQKSSAPSLRVDLYICYANSSKPQVHLSFLPSFELLYLSLFLCTWVKTCFVCSTGNGYCSVAFGVTPTVRLGRILTVVLVVLEGTSVGPVCCPVASPTGFRFGSWHELPAVLQRPFVPLYHGISRHSSNT